jgi:putative transposase
MRGIAVMVEKKYPSDLTDEEWEILKEILDQEKPAATGRPAEVDYRRVWDAIRYINKTGCQWGYLPHDFPPPTTVNYHYLKWMRKGFFERVNTEIRRRLRLKHDRNAEPSAGIIDSQSVKGTSESSLESGFDGGKRVKGRKRHIVVDTIGCVLAVAIHAANIHDSQGARLVLKKLFEGVSTIKLIWADQAYIGELIEWVMKEFSCQLEIVKKKGKGFQVLPRRWVVERTLAWLTRYRRLVRDYEKNPDSSKAMVYIASIGIMLKKLFAIQDEIDNESICPSTAI